MMRYKFQHYVDIKTSADSLNIIQIAAGGEYVRQRCKHLFQTYKYFKLGKISVKLLPASTLPVDPQGMSLDADDPYTVDPRDQMNPGLVRITNGEDILENLQGIQHEVQDCMYQNTMLDPRWSKFMLQSGFKRSAYPLYWQIGQLHQDVYPGQALNLPRASPMPGETSIDYTGTAFFNIYGNGSDSLGIYPISPVTSDKGFFQVGHRGKMGWMPTDAYEYSVLTVFDKEGTAHANGADQAMLQPIPQINCITIVLPRANKTIYYYRLFITEEVFFSGIKNVGITTSIGESVDMYEYSAIDNFTHVRYPLAVKPQEQKEVGHPSNPYNPNDGSNHVKAGGTS